MAKKPHEEVNTDGWKDTYGDMVTLLLCFFVLLYSMSSVNSEKWEAFVKAFTNPGEDTAQVVLVPSEEVGDHTVPGAEDTNSGVNTEDASELPEDFSQLFDYLEEYVEEHNMQDAVSLSESEGVVYVRYQNSLFFLPDSAELTAEARPNLDFLGQCLKELEDQIWLISISGHTAAVPYDNYAVSDWDLSTKRASAVAIHFEEENGLAPKKIRPIGYGKNYPIDTNDTPEGREHNRRVELVIISNESPIVQSEDTANAILGLFNPKPLDESAANLEELLDPDLLAEQLRGNSGNSQPDTSSAPEADSSTAPEDAGNAPEDGSSAPEDASSDAGASDAAGSGEENT